MIVMSSKHIESYVMARRAADPSIRIGMICLGGGLVIASKEDVLENIGRVMSMVATNSAHDFLTGGVQRKNEDIEKIRAEKANLETAAAKMENKQKEAQARADELEEQLSLIEINPKYIKARALLKNAEKRMKDVDAFIDAIGKYVTFLSTTQADDAAKMPSMIIQFAREDHLNAANWQASLQKRSKQMEKLRNEKRELEEESSELNGIIQTGDVNHKKKVELNDLWMKATVAATKIEKEYATIQANIKSLERKLETMLAKLNDDSSPEAIEAAKKVEALFSNSVIPKAVVVDLVNKGAPGLLSPASKFTEEEESGVLEFVLDGLIKLKWKMNFVKVMGSTNPIGMWVAMLENTVTGLANEGYQRLLRERTPRDVKLKDEEDKKEDGKEGEKKKPSFQTYQTFSLNTPALDDDESSGRDITKNQIQKEQRVVKKDGDLMDEHDLWNEVRSKLAANTDDIAYLFCSILKGKVAPQSPFSGWQNGTYAGFEDAVKTVSGILKNVVSRLDETFLVTDKSIPNVIRKLFVTHAGGEYASLQREMKVLLPVLKYYVVKSMVEALEEERSEMDRAGGLGEEAADEYDKRMDYLERVLQAFKREIAGFGAGVKVSRADIKSNSTLDSISKMITFLPYKAARAIVESDVDDRQNEVLKKRGEIAYLTANLQSGEEAINNMQKRSDDIETQIDKIKISEKQTPQNDPNYKKKIELHDAWMELVVKINERKKGLVKIQSEINRLQNEIRPYEKLKTFTTEENSYGTAKKAMEYFAKARMNKNWMITTLQKTIGGIEKKNDVEFQDSDIDTILQVVLDKLTNLKLHFDFSMIMKGGNPLAILIGILDSYIVGFIMDGVKKVMQGTRQNHDTYKVGFEADLWNEVRERLTMQSETIANTFCTIVKNNVAKQSPFSGWDSVKRDYSNYPSTVGEVSRIVREVVSRLGADFLETGKSASVAINRLFVTHAGGEYASLQREMKVFNSIIKYYIISSVMNVLDEERAISEAAGSHTDEKDEEYEKRMNYLKRLLDSSRSEIPSGGVGMKTASAPQNDSMEFVSPVEMIKTLRAGYVTANERAEKLEGRVDRQLGEGSLPGTSDAMWAPAVLDKGLPMNTNKHIASMLQRVAARVASAFCLELR